MPPLNDWVPAGVGAPMSAQVRPLGQLLGLAAAATRGPTCVRTSRLTHGATAELAPARAALSRRVAGALSWALRALRSGAAPGRARGARVRAAVRAARGVLGRRGAGAAVGCRPVRGAGLRRVVLGTRRAQLTRADAPRPLWPVGV